MMLKNSFTSEAEFADKLSTVFQPAQPIKREELLRGRSTQLTAIRRSLASPGTHVFIYGDRGIGKTSLAQTASSLHQDVEIGDIIVSCADDADFYSLVEDMACALDDKFSSTERKEIEKSGSLNLGIGGGNLKERLEQGIIPKISSINEATQLLREICERRNINPVVIIDEFDQLSNDKDKKLFADLVKRVSDTSVPVRFIFCGIGSSLEELIGVHLSTDRYLATIELDPIKHEARWEIIRSAANEFGLIVDRETEIRIGHISDGFPYYIHLIGQNMFWAMYDDTGFEGKELTVDHFQRGVKGAVQNAVRSLKMTYEKATQKYESTQQYDHVLWAVVANANFERPLTDIFEKSYLPLCRAMSVDPVEKRAFSNRLAQLTKSTHGEVLMRPRRSWYKFRENIMRGYVHLTAENAGVQLNPDHYLASKAAITYAKPKNP